jgi:protoheme IX farnesyltransferase
VLFLWQFPHFLAIAWIYRDQYARAGLRMLPARGQTPRITGLMAVGYAIVLVPLSFFPAACGLAGSAYLVVALVLSSVYVAAAVQFAMRESLRTARGLLWTSLVYLPALLITLVWDHFSLLLTSL